MGEVHVIFFASLREEVGHSELSVTASDVEGLLAELKNRLGPGYDVIVRDNVRMAVNKSLIEGNVALSAGDEVAFLPPVTGG